MQFHINVIIIRHEPGIRSRVRFDVGTYLSRDTAHRLIFTKSTNSAHLVNATTFYRIARCHLIVKDLSSYYRLSFGRGRGGGFSLDAGKYETRCNLDAGEYETRCNLHESTSLLGAMILHTGGEM